ncbi:MAG: hypothetical protein WC091_15710, partial [Sulfuricellaceae bacterium]
SGRTAALQIACVEWLHGAICALHCIPLGTIQSGQFPPRKAYRSQPAAFAHALTRPTQLAQACATGYQVTSCRVFQKSTLQLAILIIG